ncbi:GntR family transcriptional regulator [Erysipelothrix aquatica]|uniref:GntR family transcriptional regulator n=1 Tax=Erysipelothrix aquatica TaxID=2683714 RepID=UPI0013588EE4|nr:GntR family transcriptional regulator [Erysipelothrix aquatica]
MRRNYDFESKIAKNADFTKEESLVSIIYDAIKLTILEEDVPLGERINEYGLAAQLPLSRTPIRIAVKKLTDEGLLKYIPSYGAVVDNFTIKKVDEIFKIRLSLEIIIYEELLNHADVDQLNEIKSICEKAIYYNNTNDLNLLLISFAMYNKKIQEVANLGVASAMLNDLDVYLKNFREMSYERRKRVSQAVDEHSNILDALVQKNRKLLHKNLKIHVRNAREQVIKTYMQ